MCRIRVDCTMSASDLKTMEVEETRTSRPQWGSRVQYVLTLVGYSVGLGNIWRFPYICNRNGGGAFLIPFAIFLFLACFPLFFLETCVSQFSGKGTVHVWSFCPLLKGVGVGMVILGCLMVPYYNFLMAWPIYYLVQSCSAVLPWTTCGNDWNTVYCVTDFVTNVNSTTSNMTSLNDTLYDYVAVTKAWENLTLAHTAVEEFWQYKVLDISTGLGNIGSMQGHIVGCLFAFYVIMFFCIFKGIKSVGKVVYVTATLPYILLTVLLIRTLMLPGASDGLVYFFAPDFSRLQQVQVWLEACLQVFYSVGPGWGMVHVLASFNKFHEPCLRDTLLVSFISEGTSIFGGCVTFSVLGSMAARFGVPVSEVVSSGPGLGFIAYPQALSQLPVPQLWSFLFFLLLITIGLDTQFSVTEVLPTTIIDSYPRMFAKRRGILTAAICLVYFLMGLVFCTQGGPYIFQLIDWYIAALSVILFCFLECIAVGWIYGIDRFSKDIELMLGHPPPIILRFLWCFVIPVVLLTVFVLTLVQYGPPTYGKYKYPPYAVTIGWCIATVPIIPLLVCAALSLLKHRSAASFKQRLLLALRPDFDWMPSSSTHKGPYREEQQSRRRTVRENVRAVFKR
ncbi:sodium- and chloride-dependent glycine transporter 1-like [Haliotis rufescens]|uniref:sodium- and chloride-dependent glycine transporter 1-like n=1 Tax=Haliotis rufescens TaxID=6454 RepID=UPI00201F9D61|nr:sodium- and chloride-dependent glycine transporter 1-like [Haliotis rufescens]